MTRKLARSRPLARHPELASGDAAPQTRVFISYRREDTGAAAEHLYASLAQRLGADSIFRDLATIQPGQDFPTAIDEAIRGASVFIALIGPQWLTAKGQDGRRRLDSPKDLVRREIETALTLKVPVIPVLVDEAKMPSRGQLPRSIADLANRHAYTLPWQQGVTRLERRIEELERQRAAHEAMQRVECERLDLTRGRHISPTPGGSQTASRSFSIVTRAMEMSLAHQGRRTSLDPENLAASMKEINPSRTDQWFLPSDLVYVIDIVGVKAKRSTKRFVARSHPLRSLDEIPAHLQLGRPILAELMIFESWNREPALTTGFVDGEKPGNFMISMMGVILGWDPVKQQLRVLIPLPTWGDKGIATLSRKASTQSINATSLRSIEASPMPVPASPVPAAARREQGGRHERD